jgi:hypothetical protein
MRGLAIAAIASMLIACPKSHKKKASVAEGQDAAVRFASTHITFTDAAPPPPPPRLAAYLHLLAVDLYIKELVGRFPGAPSGTVFDSQRYAWYGPHSVRLEALVEAVGAAASEASKATGDTDRAVTAYAEVATRVVPPVIALFDYYRASFVDDEFDRGRREAASVGDAGKAIAAVRGELWSRVIVEWRETAGDVPDSPRAVVGRAYEACMRVGQVLATDGSADALNSAVSACRRGISPVAALPAEVQAGFEHALRGAAIALGDMAARGSTLYDAPQSLAHLTGKYLALWPSLSQTTPEKAAP